MIFKKVLMLAACFVIVMGAGTALSAKQKKRSKPVQKEAVKAETTQSALDCLKDLAKLPLSELKKPENTKALRNAYKAIGRDRDYGRGAARKRVRNRPALDAELKQLQQEFRDKL